MKFIQATADASQVLRDVINEFFGQTLALCKPEPNLSLLFSSNLVQGGFKVAWKVEVSSDVERTLGAPDATIILDIDEWLQRSDRGRKALVWSPLHGLVLDGTLREDDDGATCYRVKTDEKGRPVIRKRRPDYIERGYFESARLWGADSLEVRNHRAVGEVLENPPLPFAAAPGEPEGSPEPGDDATPDQIINAGLGLLGATGDEIEAEAARLAELDGGDGPGWHLLPTTHLEVSRGILAKLWRRHGVATLGQVVDDLDVSTTDPDRAVQAAFGLAEDEAKALLDAIERAEDAFTAGQLAAEPLPAESEAEGPEFTADEAEWARESVIGPDDDDLGDFTAGLEDDDDTAQEEADARAEDVAPTRWDVFLTAAAEGENPTFLGQVDAPDRNAAIADARKRFADQFNGPLGPEEFLAELALHQEPSPEEKARREAVAATVKMRKKKAEPEPDPAEGRVLVYTGKYVSYWLKARTLAEAIAYARERHPKATMLKVVPDVDRISLDPKRKIPFMVDLTLEAAAPAGMPGGPKEAFRCNRCNELRSATIHPCPNCECPEYGIVAVDRDTYDRLAVLASKPPRKMKSSRKAAAQA